MSQPTIEDPEIILTTANQARDSGKQAADRLYIIHTLDQITEKIDKIRQIMLCE